MEIYNASGSGLLEQTRLDIFQRLLPIIVVMAVLGIIGLLGNVLAIAFYVSNVKSSPSTVQITCLAVADLIVCIMIVPNIMEMVFNVNFKQSALCKVTHFIGYWAIASSCLILWIIAVDRHRKICKPFVKQITITQTKYIITAEIIGSLLLGARNFVNFEAGEVKVAPPGTNQTVTGHYCTTRIDGYYKLSVTVFYAIDLVLVLICWVTIIVTYSLITHKLVKLRNKDKFTPSQPVHPQDVTQTNRQELSEVSTETMDSVTKSNATSATTFQPRLRLAKTFTSSKQLDNIQLSVSSDEATIYGFKSIDPNPNDSQENSNTLRKVDTTTKASGKKRHRHRKIAARSVRERSLTLMMMIVSLIFILCLLPYFIIKIFLRIYLEIGEEYELGAVAQLALRLVYLNSVFNPMVYCLFNPQFRQYVKRVLLKCCRCRANA